MQRPHIQNWNSKSENTATIWRVTGLLLLMGLMLSTTASAWSAEGEGKYVRSNRAKYKAQRIGDRVVIVAFGTFPTGGHKAELRQLPIEVFPPQFEFVEKKPGGFVAQVITPFAVLAHFKAGDHVKSVVVHDANGKHTVKVAKPKK